MLKNGQKFLVSMDVLAIERTEGVSQTVTVPSGSVVEVEKGICADDSRMAEVIHENRRMRMFADDLHQMAKRLDQKVKAAGNRTNALA